MGKDGERVDSGKVAKAPTKIAELTRYAESKARAEGWALKKGEKADPEKAREELRKKAEETHNKAAEAIAAAKAKASATEHTVVEAVVAKIEDNGASASSAVVGAVLAVQDAVTPDTTPPAATTPASTKLIYEQRPRELDATPIPAKRADNALYTGPPLPIGFEPAPGYELARPPPAPKGDLKPATPPPAPLPLVAPAVKSLASNEPILGQLAATIDNLAKFVEAKTDDISGNATSVLVKAQDDIEQLAKRLEKIKAEETAKLEKSLKTQASEYSSLLLAAEKDLVERLDTQEEDWKKAFDEERRHLVSAYKEKLDKELETQHEIINQRLKEEVIAQGIELQRRWVREIKVRVEQERGGRLAKLEELEGGIRKLEKVTKENEEVRSSPCSHPFDLLLTLRIADPQRGRSRKKDLCGRQGRRAPGRHWRTFRRGAPRSPAPRRRPLRLSLPPLSRPLLRPRSRRHNRNRLVRLPRRPLLHQRRTPASTRRTPPRAWRHLCVPLFVRCLDRLAAEGGVGRGRRCH